MIKKQLLLAAALIIQTTVMAATIDTLTVRIKGMHCDNCARKVMKTLESLKGVEDIQFNLERNTATIAYDAALTPADSIRGRLAATGRYASSPYSKDDVILQEIGIHIDDMHCQKCYNRILSKLQPMAGVDSMAPHIDQQYIFVRYDANKTDKASIHQAVSELGFTPVSHYASDKVAYAYLLIPEKVAQDAETYEKAIALKGVEDACVNAKRNALAITFVNEETTEEQLLKDLKENGIEATLPPLHVCDEEQKK